MRKTDTHHELEAIENNTLELLARAVELREIPRIDRLNGRLQRVRGLSEEFRRLRRKVEAFKVEMSEPADPEPTTSRRSYSIQLTAGMIDNHMLVVTPFDRRIAYDESMQVVTPFRVFTTQFVKAGNKLKERGWVREFYLKRNAKAGMVVVLKEFDDGKWFLDTLAETRDWEDPIGVEQSDAYVGAPGVKWLPASNPQVMLRAKVKKPDA